MQPSPLRLPLLRNSVHGPEIHHIQRAQRDDLRHSSACGGFEPVRTRGENPAYELVRELGGREVEDPIEESRGYETLHRASPCARCMEHVRRAVVRREERSCTRHRGGRHPEHRDRDPLALIPPPRRLRLRLHPGRGRGRVRLTHSLLVRPRHARDRARRVLEDRAEDVVQARDVHDAVHDRDVRVLDEGTDVS